MKNQSYPLSFQRIYTISITNNPITSINIKIDSFNKYTHKIISQSFFTVIFLIGTNVLAQNSTPTFTHSQSVNGDTSSPVNRFINAQVTYKIIDVPNKTYGYDIYVDGKIKIHQPSIPALSGNEGFKKKEYAIKVALLVIDKIKNGEMLPSVTIEEMRKLKVIK